MNTFELLLPSENPETIPVFKKIAGAKEVKTNGLITSNHILEIQSTIVKNLPSEFLCK
jgi:hypothetical protein